MMLLSLVELLPIPSNNNTSAGIFLVSVSRIKAKSYITVVAQLSEDIKAEGALVIHAS